MKNFSLPWYGGGAGLRHEHFAEIRRSKPPFPWFEIIVEDFLNVGGYAAESFEEIASNYKVIPHGVGLSIGSTDPLDLGHLNRVKGLLSKIDAPWFSDHLCFTMIDHANLENLIPVAFTEEAVSHIVSRIQQVQDHLRIPFLLENVTRYITVSDREMDESEFINQIVQRSGCGLLLDITNVILNSKYHGYDPQSFIASLPLERVGQIHLAGWEEVDDILIDSHDAPVPPEVWSLLEYTLHKTGPTSVLVEWDKSLPSVDRLLKEALHADKLVRSINTQNTQAVEGQSL